MKICKIKPFLLLAAISFILIAANICGNKNLEFISENNNNSNIFNNPVISGNHDPILIDGNVALDAFITDEELSGDGTSYETSYVIENFTIDGSTESGIEIQDTDAFLIIRNCTVLNTGTLDEEYAGIYIRSCSNIEITNCTLDNNERGIAADYDSFDITIKNNTILHSGITVSGFQKKVLNNTLMFTDGSAIELWQAENNSVTGNIMTNNGGGIGITYSHNNTLFENEIYCSTGDGISLAFSNENNITKNVIIDNGNGFWLTDSSSNNIIYFNNIYGNLEAYGNMSQAFEDESSTDNQWDNGTTGNFWGNDYIIRYPDATNDGTVWDTPFEIGGVGGGISGGGIDHFPLVHSIFPDFEDPQFTDVPGDFSADEGYSGLNISWIATDLHPATYTIELNEIENNSATDWTSGTGILFDIPDGLLEGNYSITIIVLDGDGNSAQDTVIFTVNADETTNGGIPGFPILNILIFISVGVFLLRRKINLRRIKK